MSNIFLVSLLTSLVIHSAGFFLFQSADQMGGGGSHADGGSQNGGKGKSKEGGGEGHVKFLPKPNKEKKPKSSDKKKLTDNRSKVIIQEKKKEPEVPPAEKVVDHKCENYYTGIGIRTSWGNCEITEVVPGYPADRAGLKAGDLMMDEGSESGCPGRGEEGTILEVKVLRGTKSLTFRMVREKICTEKETGAILP